jgi:Tfp pilus assembly protein PilX
MNRRQTGAALVVGLMLLTLITLLGLAAAATAQLELMLARNERFRENAASAASAGIEYAISHLTASAPESAPSSLTSPHGEHSHFEVRVRFMGYELGLPQAPGANLAAAHFEILSNGHSGRGATDRQRAIVMHIVAHSAPVLARDCQPATAESCETAGVLHRLAWQRLP